jgi:catechol 2,3-dioxygenase-like lactoylglutathione lyase family enzyme
MAATLKYVMLLQRDVPRAVAFYQQGLGMKATVVTERWAELQSGSFKLALKAADGCAPASVPARLGLAASGACGGWVRWRGPGASGCAGCTGGVADRAFLQEEDHAPYLSTTPGGESLT